MSRWFYWIGLAAVAVLTGCSAHNPMNPVNVAQARALSPNRYPPHTNKVFVSRGTLPPTMEYEVIGQIDVGKAWYGSSAWPLVAMANKARQLGADAVIQARTWHQPSGWAWASPQGSGMAVKFKDASKTDFSKIEGQWY